MTKEKITVYPEYTFGALCKLLFTSALQVFGAVLTALLYCLLGGLEDVEEVREKQRHIDAANMNWAAHNCDPLYTPGSTMNPIKKR